VRPEPSIAQKPGDTVRMTVTERPGSTPTSALTVVDLSSKFLAFYDSASAASPGPDDRWLLWKRLYGFAAVPPTPFGDSLARRLLDGAWPRYATALDRIRGGAARLGLVADTALQQVIALFGCGQGVNVRLTLFVGGFDENAFAFTLRDGTPSIAIPLESGDARRSVMHELAHAVHRSRGCANLSPGYEQSLAELVLAEGVAMRAVEQLMPGRPAAYYMIADQGWLDTAITRKASILRGVRENLDTAGAAVVQRFTFGAGSTGLHREAYYAGWEVTGALLSHGTSLIEIVNTSRRDVSALVRRGIDLSVSQTESGRDAHVRSRPSP
jgi:hypothetical protein